MKTLVQITKLLLIAIFLMSSIPLSADAKSDNYFTINGVVRNGDNNKRIDYANITIKGTNIGTVANENGEFTLKVKSSTEARLLVVSHVGFVSTEIHIDGANVENLKVTLMPRNTVLNEVIVRGDAQSIVLDAIRRIKTNYEERNCMLTGFYRETARKRQHYITISEAITDVYKSDYNKRNVEYDRVQILKGRKLLSEKKGDTLAVRLLGGPNLAVFGDMVKNAEVLLNEEDMMYYFYKLEDPVFIDHRMQYVVSITPRVRMPYALYNGRLFIDSESLAFTRIELSLDMSDRNKATQAILKRKPFGLIFKPQELTFLVDYKEREGKMTLNYIRNEIRFKCDWKRKLFSTSYSIISEMVITDLNSNDVKHIPYRAAFNERDSFTDKVDAFYDENFWGEYNIIAPTESLEKAVNKLKKQYK
jgi:hypothetical protein